MKIFELFSPGPTTILIPKRNSIPSIVTAGSNLVGVRIPDHLIAQEFLLAAGVPVVAPSANKSGKPSATHHSHVISAFGGEVPNVILGGSTTLGVESTVLLPQNNERIVIMRLGAVSKEELQKVFPTIEIVYANARESKDVPSPGSRYRHYAPTAEISIVPLTNRQEEIGVLKDKYEKSLEVGEIPAIICSSEMRKELPENYICLEVGSEIDLNTVASNLYKVLLQSDTMNITRLIMQSFQESGIGRTIMERIVRAASTK